MLQAQGGVFGVERVERVARLLCCRLSFCARVSIHSRHIKDAAANVGSPQTTTTIIAGAGSINFSQQPFLTNKQQSCPAVERVERVSESESSLLVFNLVDG